MRTTHFVLAAFDIGTNTERERDTETQPSGRASDQTNRNKRCCDHHLTKDGKTDDTRFHTHTHRYKRKKIYTQIHFGEKLTPVCTQKHAH